VKLILLSETKALKIFNTNSCLDVTC